MSNKIKNILIGGIAAIALGALPLLSATNNQYQKGEAVTDFDPSDYTKVTSENINSVADGAQVYLVQANESLGIGLDPGLDNKRAETKAQLSLFNLIHDESGTSLYSEETSKYITLASNSVVNFNSDDRTIVSVDTDGKISYYKTNKDYFLCYSLFNRLEFQDEPRVSDYIYAYVAKDTDMSATNRYAYHLLNDLSCDSTGVSAPSSVSWKNIQTTYYNGDIGSAIKDMSGDEDSPIIIERALAKYDYVIGKYKDRESYPHYITGRAEPSLLHNSDGYTDVVTFSKDNTTAIIVTISAAVLSATIVSYFVIRKKKQD